MSLYLLAALALVAVIAPFVPGWIELRRGKDSHALPINMDHSKTPFFFGDQFAGLLRKGLREVAGLDDTALPLALEQKEYAVMLSRREKVRVVTEPAWACEAGTRMSGIVYVAGDLLAGEKSRFSGEMLVEGNADIQSGCRLRALLCNGELKLGENVHVGRWLDARGGALSVGPGCNLGRNAASSGVLLLERGCRFNNLYGAPVRTFSAPPKEPPFAEGNIREKALVATALQFSIPAGAELHNNVISSQDLKICSGSAIYGDIKGHRGVELEDGVTVYGTVVADQDVIIGSNCRVLGNVFAQGDVRVGFGSTVGEKDHVKSVISRSSVFLETDVTVHGHVACEKGLVAGE